MQISVIMCDRQNNAHPPTDVHILASRVVSILDYLAKNIKDAGGINFDNQFTLS